MYKSSFYSVILFSFVFFLTQMTYAANNIAIENTPIPCSSTTNASICAGNSYTFNGMVYSTAGTYTAHLTSATGGDSTAILNLTVNPIPLPTITPGGLTTFCAGDSVKLTASAGGTYFWNTGEKTQSIIVKSSGYYHAFFTDNNGCYNSTPETGVTVNPLPTITTGAIADVCSQATSVFLPYTATTGNPDQYSITWNQGVAMANVGWTALGASPIIINNPPWASGNYAGVLKIRNSITGCVSTQGTSTVTQICATAGESGYVVLTAPTGGLISEITFASYGTPKGSCGNFSINPNCHSVKSDSVPKARCIGQIGCAFSAANSYFGDPCPNTFKFMYVQANAVTINPPNPINFNVKRQSTSTTNASICAGSTYSFNGNTYSNAGSYSVYLTNSVGCDSVAILNLTVKAKSTSTTNATICSNSSYTFNGTVYSTAGTYVAHFTNAVGCDSAATLILKVNNQTNSTTKASICSNTTYIFNGTAYNTSGTYVAHLINAVGCDSVATLVLTVNNPTSSITNATICTGASYTFNGTAYATAGTYVTHLTNANGCDSIATLILTLNNSSVSTTTASICLGGNYSFNGAVYTNAGTYTAHLTNSVGCDSAATLFLTVNNPTVSTTNASICTGSSYTFNGAVYSIAGTYTIHLTNSVGCDSVATLILTVNAMPVVAAINGTKVACAGKTATLTEATLNGIWSSSNNSIATVTTNGIVTGIASGTTNIIYTVSNGSGCSASASVAFVVNPNPVLDTIVGNNTVCVGATSALTNSTLGGTWSSFDYYVGTINQLGVFTGNAYGTTAVSYTVTNSYNCITKVSTVFTVNNNPYVGSIVGSNTVCTGNLDTLKPGASFGTWSSSNNTVATISSNGYVSGLTAGKDTISYTLTNVYGCTSVATTVITVITNPLVLDTIIGNSNVCVGSTVQLSNSSQNGRWSSFTNYVGSITSGGAFTGNAYGTTNVSYFISNSDGCTAKTTKVFSVFNKPYIGTLTGANSVCSGSSVALKASVGGGNWTVSNNAIASVNNIGVVTGIMGGVDTVLYSLTNSNGCTATLIQPVLVASTSSITSASICSGSSYSFNGTDYNTSGTYTAHLMNAAGCDSAATLLLTVKSATYSRTNASICAGTSYLFNGISYNTSGTYTTHLINNAGCDSAATLVLTVRNITYSTTNASICSGTSYSFNGNVYSAAGTYTVYLTNAENCDSVATLVLIVTPLPAVAEIHGVHSICKGTVTVLSESTVGGTWLSANNKVGVLNGNGSVIGAAIGTDTISYAVTNACGTATTSIVIAVADLLYVAPISGVEGICLGTNTIFTDTSIGGVWSVSNPSIATIDALGNLTSLSAGKATINYSITNGCGIATATKDIIVSTSKPVVQIIGGVSTACSGTTSTLTNTTIGGKWSSDDITIASVNDSTGVVSAIADGTANIAYTVGAALGCTASVSVPFTVSCSTVTTGGEGGLESKSMGDAVAKRVYNRALSNTNNTVDYSMMPIVKEGRGKLETMGVATPGTQAVTYLMPSLNAIGTGFTGYDMSAGVADLPGITNASIVKAYDYTVNAQTKASTLISRTYGLVYQHTKPICDRLKEATLMDVKQVTVQGMNFIQYKLLQNSGQIEYAISFSAGIQQGVDSFKIQSVWLTQNFLSQDTMFNFQIWSVDAGMTLNMLKSTLNKLGSLLPLTQVNNSFGVPSTFISKITRNQNKLLLTINNNSASTNGSLNLVLKSNENSTSQNENSIPVSFLPNATSEVAVDLNDNYESDVHLFVDGVQQDLAYMNDGNWNYSVSNAAVHPNSFNIINDGVMPVDSTEFRLLRNVHVNVNVSDYVSIYKMMKAGGVTKDLTQFANLEFNAAAVSAGQIKIVIQKSSITNWNSQYSYTQPISGNLNHYKVKLSDFVSSTSTLPLNANDVITVTFSFISSGGNNIDATLADAKFTQNKSVTITEVIDSFSTKTVSAYPNPAVDRFVCTFQSDKKASMTLKIVELSSGRVVEVQTINALIGNNAVQVFINRSKVRGGSYILVLEGEEVKYQPFKMLFKD